MTFFIKNDGEPMTAQEKRRLYPDGRCPLCMENHGWTAGTSADEGRIDYYFVQCDNCKTEFPEDE